MQRLTIRPDMGLRLISVLALSGVFGGLVACTEPDTSRSQQPVRNVIVFIGDGMGVSTVTAARIFDGQSRGESGEESWLSFERFPRTALVKTYNTNQQVPDSAGTATAIHTGVKTRAGVINIGPDADRRDCQAASTNALETFLELARDGDKSVGIVTTSRVTHATPAAVYARTPERDWESDRFLTEEQIQQGCGDIAQQLVGLEEHYMPEIVLGGGRREFLGSDSDGQRIDPGDDLVADWLAAGSGRRVVTSSAELEAIQKGERVLGLFSDSHMTYVAERQGDSTEPTIQQMTAAALEHLPGQDDGFYLLVEGARIDHAHHDGKPGYAMLETQAFAEAVEVALGMVDLSETLILVTADHSHTVTLSGYPTRGNPILGHVVTNDKSGNPAQGPALAADGQPYTSVGYANGPGAVTEGPRPVPETGIDAIAQSLVPMARPQIDGTVSDSETHGGEDVVLYATGRGSECVAGVIEQDQIFDFITSAYGWSDFSCELPVW